ncbi:MAG: hypothetical protein GY789_14635 [Hyphomicrobiales bacterium]|nr:hypothetical protein [Hyphomicrobiales bacterium]
MIAHFAVLAGCVSASLEDAAPTADASNSGTAAADSTSEQTEPRDNSFVDAGALRNDDFPTFEKTPQGATVQLSDEEKQDLLNQMQALKAAQRRGGSSSAAYAARYKELQEIARSHGVETKNQIEQ